MDCSVPRGVTVTATYAELRAQHDSCRVGGDAMSLACLAAMRRICVARSCGTPVAWGPWGITATGLNFTCAAGAYVSVPRATLFAYNSACTNPGLRSLACAEAAHAVCWNTMAMAIGMDVQEYDGLTTAWIGCMPQVVAGFQVAQPTLPPCNEGTLYSPECFTGILSYCRAQGYAAGIGPLTPGSVGTRYIGCYQ